MPAPTTKNLTILLTDIKGFTDRTSRITRSGISDLLEKHRELVLPILEARGGTLIKTIGDAFLMVFESPTEAVLAGAAVQEKLARYNADKPQGERIEIRIAINAGEVNLLGGDVYGEAVNIAARVEALTEAGEVYFTDAVYLSMNKAEAPSSVVGLYELKGIPERVRIHRFRRGEPSGRLDEAAQPPRKPEAPAKLKADSQIADLIFQALKLEGFFPEFTVEHLEKLFPRSGLYLFPEGFRLIEQGTEGHEIFIICDGVVEIVKTVGSAAASLARLGRGDILGEMALVRQGPRTATAIVLSPSRVYCLAYEDLRYIYKNNPELTAHLRNLTQQRG